MTNLKSTQPHFIRCLIPNEFKTHHLFDAHLILHQLHCNNILEGIRISCRSFPCRMTFEQFHIRYGFLTENNSKNTKQQQMRTNSKKQLKKKFLLKQKSKEKSSSDEEKSITYNNYNPNIVNNNYKICNLKGNYF